MGVLARAPRYVTAAPLFVPTDIAGLELWFDASDSATITHSSNLVSQWNDKSGNARHVSNGANQPTTNTVTIGGLNAIAFDASDVLTRGSVTLDTTALTFFGVVDSGGSHRSFFTSKGGGGIGFTTNGDGSGGLGLIFPGVATEDTATANNNALVFLCRRTGGTATVYVNGGTSVMTSTATPGAGFNDIYVGKDASGAANENLGEILWYSSALSTADLNSAGQYLATKWGLSWTSI